MSTIVCMLKTVNTPGSTPGLFPINSEVECFAISPNTHEDSHFASVVHTQLSRVNQEFTIMEDICVETDFAGIVAQSSPLRQVLQLVELVTATTASLLLPAETASSMALFS